MAALLCDDIERRAFDDKDPKKDKNKKNHDAVGVDEEGYGWCDASTCSPDDYQYADVEL